MEKSQGFIYCSEFKENGYARDITDDRTRVWQEGVGTVWFHLDYTDEDAKQWHFRAARSNGR